MASEKKRRVEPMEQDSDEEVTEGTTVDLDLDARQPEESDRDGIIMLLKQQFLKADMDLNELTDVILEQNFVGSVSKQFEEDTDANLDDDEDPSPVLCFLTVINITEKKDLNCVKQIKTLLVQRCKECASGQLEKLTSILEDPCHDVGLILNERFFNLPPLIAVPSFHSLRDDIVKAKQKNQKFDFSYYLLICKTYAALEKGKKHPRQNKPFFRCEEEELIHELADFSFSYSVVKDLDTMWEQWSPGDEEGEGEMEPLRTVIVISGDKLDLIVNKIQQTLSVQSK